MVREFCAGVSLVYFFFSICLNAGISRHFPLHCNHSNIALFPWLPARVFLSHVYQPESDQEILWGEVQRVRCWVEVLFLKRTTNVLRCLGAGMECDGGSMMRQFFSVTFVRPNHFHHSPAVCFRYGTQQNRDKKENPHM